MKTPSVDLQEKWLALADNMRAEANAVPAGRARDGLLRRIAQLERAISPESQLMRRNGANEPDDPPDNGEGQQGQ